LRIGTATVKTYRSVSHLSPEPLRTPSPCYAGNAAQFPGRRARRHFHLSSSTPLSAARSLSSRIRNLFSSQRFNVAASRGPATRCGLSTSLSPNNDLKADDLRRQLIEHAQDIPAASMRASRRKGKKRTQSGFLNGGGPWKAPHRCRLSRRSANGALVPFESTWSLEGDGRRPGPSNATADRYHPLRKKLPEDMDRQSVSRAQWAGYFSRVFRGTEFLRNPDRAMKPVFEKLPDA